jgi:tetratricopeptide (TPR) repeat protein
VNLLCLSDNSSRGSDPLVPATRSSRPNHFSWLLIAATFVACSKDQELVVAQRYVREVCACGDWSCVDTAQKRFEAARPKTSSKVVIEALKAGSTCRARLSGPLPIAPHIPTEPPPSTPAAPTASAPPAPLDAASQREFLKARKAVKNRSYDEALTYYTRALSHGIDSALCLGERGYVRLLTGDLEGALEDLWYAAGAAGDNHVYSQIWFNLGLAHQQKNEPEEARAAFARALAFEDTSASRAKLGSQSRCTTAIRKAPDLPENPTAVVVRGWKGVHSQLNLEGPASTETEAKATVCSTVSQAYRGDESAYLCDQPPPWELSCCSGLGRFMVRHMTVVPRSKNRFFTIDHGSRGGWPKQCQGAPIPENTIFGSALMVKEDGPSVEINPDVDINTIITPDNPAPDLPCRTGPTETTVTFYQLDTGRPLLQLLSAGPNSPSISVAEGGTTVTLRGGSCDATLPLSSSTNQPPP